MSNSNNSEPRVRFNPKTSRALYEFSILDGGVVVIKTVIVPREDLLVADGKVKDGRVFDARVTD